VVGQVASEYGGLLRTDLQAQAETEDTRREAAEAAERLERRIAECYPFHPELIDLMYQRWGSLPSYQRTRGALQFLATVVHALWSEKANLSPQGLIGPGDVDLADEAVRTSFFEQVGEATQYAAVVQADFLGPNAGTKTVDERIGRESPALRSLRVGTRVATAIALLSFGAREGEESGALEREVVQACLVPGLDGNLIREALTDMRRETLLYLHHTGRRYRFETRPNLNLLIANEENKLTSEEVMDSVRAKLERGIGTGGQQISIWPDGSAKIADGLPAFITVYLRPDADTSPDELARLVTHCGEAPRKHKNGIALVIAAEPTADAARGAGRTLNAVSALLGHAAQHQFSAEQKDELKERAGEAERALATSVGQMYERILLPVSTDGPAGVRFESVDLGTVLAAGRSIHERVRDALNLHVFDTLKSKRLLALTKLAERGTVRCDVLIESFFSYYEFTKLWGVGPLHEAIAAGVASGDFAYAVGVAEQNGELSVADRNLVHIGQPLNQSEIDLGPGAVLLTDNAARALIGEPSVETGGSGAEQGTVSDHTSPGSAGEVAEPVADGEKGTGYHRVSLNISATEDDLHTVQRALSGLRDVTLPGTMQIQVRVLAERAEGEIDDVTFRNRVREPLEEDSDVSHQEEWG
jgi:hypothetical protein